MRVNRKELIELIDSVEAGGGEASQLRHELEALAPEAKPVPQTRTRRNSRLEEEEETSEDRLIRREGDLFPGGTPPFKEIYDYDYRFTKNELVEQCRKAGLGVSGDKHDLAAKLIAKGLDVKRVTQTRGEVYIARELPAFSEEAGHPALPEGVTFPVQYTEVKVVIDDTGYITYTYWPSVGVGHIEMIMVKEDYRRRGFGSKFVQFAIDDMKKKGIVKVSASIWSKEGENLLKAHGFSYVNDLMERTI